MEHYTYLLVDLLTVIFCFVFSFHSKIGFNRYFIPFLKAAVLVALPFIVWDSWFTASGIWWFNDRYLIGIRLLGLPLEEWLFFICIPFSCLFTYYIIQNNFQLLKWNDHFDKYFAAFCILVCLAISGLNIHKLYSFVTFLVTALSLLYLKFIAKVDWMGEVSLVYTILLIPFFMVNGVLTGTGLKEPIVNYNPAAHFNIRILTVPIEDAVYGYNLIIWNIYFFKWFTKNLLQKTVDMN